MALATSIRPTSSELTCNGPTRGEPGRRMVGAAWQCALLCILGMGMFSCSATAQEKDAAAERKGKSSNRRAIAYYSDAASFQNNGKYSLAVEEWEKLLKEFPNDPLASKAWHYLGVCNIQLETPNYSAAIQAFSNALKDKDLEVREESLINLSWCLFTQARSEAPGSPAQKEGLEQAKQRLGEFLSKYSDGSFADQALFYLGEIEYSLGNAKRSIEYYSKLLSNKQFAQSSLRPDARYALAVAYEEEKLTAQAKRQYEQFLSDHPKHRLAAEVRVRLADMLLVDGDAEKAEALLSSLVSNAGHSDVTDYALLRLGYAVSRSGNNDQAAKFYQRLLKEFPESKHVGTAAVSLGQVLYQQGNYDAALEQFAKAIGAQNNQAAEAAHWSALTLLRQNKASEAAELLEPVLKWSDKTPAATSLRMDFADALYAQPDKLEAAQTAYEKLATDSPEDPLAPRAAYNAAFAALQRGQLTEARKWSERFLNKYPQDPLRNDVAYVAAEALLQQGEHDAAAKAYAKLLEVDPKNEAASLWTLRQAMALYLANEYEQAVELLSSAQDRFQQDRQKAEAQFIVGRSYLYLERIPEAIEQLELSHRTSDAWPSADEVLLVLAEAHQRNKDNDSAKKVLQVLLKKYPNTRLKAQVDYKLAQLSAALNNFDDAISRYRKIVDDESAKSYHNFARYGIAWCQMQQDEYQAALDALQPLLAQGLQDSIGSEAQLAEGVCLRKLGKFSDSVESLQQFLNTSPTGTSLANGRYELGLAYSELGQTQPATDLFESILRDSPNYPAIDKVLYELAWNNEEADKDQAATKYFKELAQRFPESEFSAEAQYMLAQKAYKEEQYNDAVRAYRLVLSQTSDDDLKEKAQYKLAWSLFQLEQFPAAKEQFRDQATTFADGELAVDGLFMAAECDFEQDNYERALVGYRDAREKLENSTETAASDQVRTLIYLHGAQCYREQKQWDECEQWLRVVLERFPESPYLPTTLYELGYCKQQQGKFTEALKYYAEVANTYRNEIAARSRFMMGEVYFAQRDFAKAIPEFQRVMYGFGGDKAPEEIRNWQAQSAFEAARCSEVLIESLRGAGRKKVIESAVDYYNFIVEKHAEHNLASKAQTRLGELQKLR